MNRGELRPVLTRRKESEPGGGAMVISIEQVFAELLSKAEAGELPPKKADMLMNLKDRVARGMALSEMQEELLLDLGAEYGVCE
jgi:hypothetical protein